MSEIARIRSGLDEGVRAVLVSGPAGIGKTRLTEEATTGSRTVRRVRGSAAISTVPLGAYAEYLTGGEADPALRIGQLIAALSGPPGESLVVVDDVQELDPLSLAVTRALAQSPAVPVVLIWRTGDEEAGPDLADLLRVDGLDRIELAPLPRPEVDALARTVLGPDVDDEALARLWHRSEGNPLFLTALLADPDAAREVRSTTPAVTCPRRWSISSPPGCARCPPRCSRCSTSSPSATPSPTRCSPGSPGPPRWRRRSAAVKRALLASRSDAPDRDAALVDGSVGAIGLAALPLAIDLASRVGPGPHLAAAQLTAAHAMTVLGDADGAETMYARISTADLTAPQWESLLVLMAYTRLWSRNDAAGAARVLSRATDAHAGTAALAAEAMLLTAAGAPREAIGLFARFHAGAPQSEQARITVAWAELTALAEAGAMSGLDDVMRAETVRAETSALIGYWRLTLAFPHLRAQKLAGAPDLAQRAWETVRAQVPPQPGAVTGWLTGFDGIAASARGDLRAAGATLDEALAEFDAADCGPEMWFGFALERAEVAAQAGDHEVLTALLERLSAGDHAGYASMRPLWQAVASWSDALAGAVSAAIRQCLDAAESARAAGQSAFEVYCLQTAVRFGATTAAERLAALAEALPDLPRARLAAVHAAAVAAADGAALIASSEEYERYGLLPEAADAAAQAATAYRGEQWSGSALTATERMRSLADQSGANTPAMAAVVADDGLTDRQREIVRLAANGLSNKEIAERLVVSVRTVEGHLYRASQILGAPVRGS
ncbi:putative LuxR family transcriptional regulator [Gordonia araii NBRC 100433]|uniref:Putative LuxR family transcriptional regulator n=1 Tax=Gordonia araii NBRC 100433 TaxID=1073574 RepID=G7GYC8_9ACTN|nr:helix-turn-helix transcriptional regulator [Gordonia araii]NNG97399.1 helix-turn-helix transcriptional regulator [Gordonia araii NBRC 100433]GAB08603.1 putative LuxR family transcriptional regulator [Gordonia araii NBRC 100433]